MKILCFKSLSSISTVRAHHFSQLTSNANWCFILYLQNVSLKKKQKKEKYPWEMKSFWSIFLEMSFIIFLMLAFLVSFSLDSMLNLFTRVFSFWRSEDVEMKLKLKEAARSRIRFTSGTMCLWAPSKVIRMIMWKCRALFGKM